MKQFKGIIRLEVILDSASMEKAISDIKGKLLRKDRFNDMGQIALGYDIVEIKEIDKENKI